MTGADGIPTAERVRVRLAREVWGIGFKTADTIARAVGIAPDAPERLQAGVLHALGTASDEGHTLLPDHDLVGAPRPCWGWRPRRRWRLRPCIARSTSTTRRTSDRRCTCGLAKSGVTKLVPNSADCRSLL